MTVIVYEGSAWEPCNTNNKFTISRPSQGSPVCIRNPETVRNIDVWAWVTAFLFGCDELVV